MTVIRADGCESAHCESQDLLCRRTGAITPFKYSEAFKTSC